MNAHIITIGDEILIGQTLNTNAAFIGTLLSQNQINVSKTSVVGDDEQDIINEFNVCWAKNDLVICTGGLGPTIDDVTRKCIVQFFESELILDQEVLADIKERFERLKRVVTKLNEDQAMIPQCAVPIKNRKGTAPGYWIEQDKKIFIALPGVPSEMKEMMLSFVIPELKNKIGDLKKIRKTLSLLTTGIPESTLFQKLGNLSEILQGAKIAFLPNQFGTKLRISDEAEDERVVDLKLSEIELRIKALVGRYIYGKGDDDISETVCKLLIDRGMRISIAESCTGGNISNRLTNISGSSKFFDRGIVAYSNAAKVELLKVDEETIIKFGSVSEEVAKEMAIGIKEVSGTDLGIGITGIMGPTGATDGKQIGTVFIAIADDTDVFSRKFLFGDDRILNKDRASQAALDVIRRYLLGISLET
ncbi:MAG: competence/damage-inducible protein A [Chlorobiaceae bacterium]|nr:competence/damage-inducible protein A [Chlorobiaceae bacterium]MBA4308832.1 competence/damage-inducible protein A [Chlorobiaceae bacterium]